MSDGDKGPFARYEVRDKLAVITFTHGPLNIIDLAAMDALIPIIRELAKDPSPRALLFEAEGKCFCAGMDIDDHTPECAGGMMERFNALFLALHELPIPIIGAIQGAALGGGFELAMACDLLIASDRARFGQPEIKLGFFPPLAAILLPHLIGPQRAHEINLIGAPISAQQAHQMGLVNRVVPATEFPDAVAKFVGQITQASGAVSKLYKKTFRQTWNPSFPEQLALAKDIFVEELLKTEDVREGLRAFSQKEEPQWKDK